MMTWKEYNPFLFEGFAGDRVVASAIRAVEGWMPYLSGSDATMPVRKTLWGAAVDAKRALREREGRDG